MRQLLGFPGAGSEVAGSVASVSAGCLWWTLSSPWEMLGGLLASEGLLLSASDFCGKLGVCVIVKG